MKKAIFFVTAILMLLPLAACRTTPGQEANNSPKPAETVTGAPTEAVTGEPTNEPVVTAAPTAEPTREPDPTPSPEPIEHDFFAEAVKVAHIDWGAGDNRIAMQWGTDTVEPDCFAVSDGKLYLPDFWGGHMILVYDLASGDSVKIGPLRPWGEFSVSCGKLVTLLIMYDLETLEETRLGYIMSDASAAVGKVSAIIVRDGVFHAYLETSSSFSSHFSPADFNGEYILDTEAAEWVFSSVPELYEKTNVRLEDGETFPNGRFLGFDADGNGFNAVPGHELLEDGSYKYFLTVSRYSSDGTLLSFFVLDEPEGSLSYLHMRDHSFILGDDGALYYMLKTDAGIDVYRIVI